MRGAYKSGQRRVLVGSGYKIAIGVVVAIAVALVMLLLAFLPATEDTLTTERKIVSIEKTTADGVGINSNPAEIYVTVHYSDGTSTSVPLSGTVYEGLDLTKPGTNNVVLSYGGFEQSVTFEVENVDCVVKYESSVGGTVKGELTQYVPNGGSAATVVAVPETGYVFEEWSDGYPKASRKDTGVTENKSYIAKFKKARYTVRFYYDNGTVASEEKVSFGESATKAPVYGSDPGMEKYGYTFVGWNPSDYSSIDRDMIYRPIYQKTATDVLMTVPADVYGNDMGQITMRSEGYYAHDKTATIIATPYNSRKFSHWIITGVDGKEYEVKAEGLNTVPVGISGQQLTFASTKAGSSAEDYQLSFTPNADVSQINIKAIFAYNATDITFMNYLKTENGGVEYVLKDLPYDKPISYVGDGIPGFKDGLPVPEEVNGMEFIGWYVAGDGAQKIIDKEEKFAQPTTLVAKWKRKEYTLIFMGTGSGVGDEYRTTVVYQDSFASGTNGGLPDVNPVKEHYDFVGWADALTGATVDDKTQLYYDERYASTEDFKNGIIRIMPIWEAKKHRLYLGVEGSGTAYLTINEGKYDSDGNSLERKETINGEYVISEDNTYRLTVEALRGNEIVSSIWEYNGVVHEQKEYLAGTNNASFDVKITSDNAITVRISVKKVKIDVTNGDGYYAGHIVYEGATFEGSAESFSVDFGSNIVFFVDSYNPIYSIKRISVNGEEKFVSTGETDRQYTLVLSGIERDTAVEIEYYTKKYSVWVENAAGGDTVRTDLFDLTRESPFFSSGEAGGTEYSYGDKLYLRLKADDGSSARNVISYLRINGVYCDLYAPTVNDVRLHNWYVNGVSAGVAIKQINDSYYYSYGEKSYETADYVYTESCEDKKSVVFMKKTVGETVVYTEIKREENPALYNRLYADLSIAERSIFDTSGKRDLRITAVDVIIDVSRNYNVNLGFAPIKYEVGAVYEGEGEVSVTASAPGFNGSSVLTASPAPGYYVAGYRINGGAVVNAEYSKKGEDFSLGLTEITEDKRVEFFFEPIKYRVVFEHVNPTVGSAYLDGVLLNSSQSKECVYHSSCVADITVTEGYRISSVTVEKNGVTVSDSVHYNMSEYRFSSSDVTDNVTVRITTAPRTVDEAVDCYDMDLSESAVIGNATVSAEYVKAEADRDNNVRVIADYGYVVDSVTVKTKDSSVILDASVTAGAKDKKVFDFTIPAGTFGIGDAVTVVVSTYPEQYVLTTAGEGEGSVSSGKPTFFGTEEEVEINANANCYIAAVYVNGEEVSFGSQQYWKSLTRDGATGKFVSGVFRFSPETDMDVKAVFSRNVYKISVDSSSVNGTTTLSVNKNNESEEGAKDVPGITDGSASSYVPHGWFVSINMSADVGYHIARLFVNDVEIELGYDDADPNALRSATYVYKGSLYENKRVGATGRINVKVVYEINKYGFTYKITNASQNFASDAFSGTVSASYALDGNRYYGIEHGGNFAFTVTPSTANGYYLSSIRMVYKSAHDSVAKEITHRPGDPALAEITSKGGTVWFNRFTESSDGLTADIELIEVTFDRNIYSVEMEQFSASYTGSMRIDYRHGNADVYYAVIYDSEGNAYRYRDGVFYTYDGNVRTGIELVYSAGKYVYTDGIKEYSMLIEHGLRYTVYVTPEIGYERIAFGINGEDALSRVSDNRYATNVDRALVITAEFRVLTYDVEFLINVNDKDRTGKISATEIKKYADIYVKVVEGDIYYLDYSPVTGHEGLFELVYGEESIRLSGGVGYKLGYGAKIQFVMYPRFDTTGYYLSSFVLADTDLTERLSVLSVALPEGTREALVYGGANAEAGYTVTENMTARSTFDVSRYNIYTEVVYDDGIVGETANYLKEESGYSTAWGDFAEVKVFISDGFVLDRIFVKRGTDDVGHDVNLVDSADDDAFDEQMYYNKRNVLTNEYRDVLRVRKVGTDVYLTAHVSRRVYTVRYVFDGAQNLYEAETSFNDIHVGYPKYSVSSNGGGEWMGNVFVFEAYHYDELSARITPKNGYRILPVDGTAEYKAVVRAVRYDEQKGEWVPIKDNAGNPVFTELNLSDVGNDVRSFSFHSPTSPVTTTYVFSDIEIEFSIEVKKYDVKTTVGFADAFGKDNLNSTVVSWEIKDGNGNSQDAVAITRAIGSATRSAEHHGTLNYSFTAPEGYRLTGISINGRSWNDIEKEGVYNSAENKVTYVSDDLRYTITYNDNATYSYSITFTINDSLVKGAYAQPQTAIEAYMETAPITYDIKTYINGVFYENSVYDGLNGVSDGSTAVINCPAQAEHFNRFSFKPAPYEGFTVKSLTITTGDESGTATDETQFVIGNPSGEKNYSVVNIYIPGVNMLAGKLTLHVFYETEIVSYKVGVYAYGYSYGDGVVKKDEDGVVSDSSEGYVDYDTAMGTVNVSVSTEGVGMPFANNAYYQYFSEVRIEALAKDGYVLYDILETTDGTESSVKNGVRGISYYKENVGSYVRHVVRYSVDSLGDRRFKLVFKQKTQVTVFVPSPYKYVTGSYIGDITYYGYVSLVAKENGVPVENLNKNGDNVCDKYVYDVLVGNYFALIYNDLYAKNGQSSYSYYTYDAEKNAYSDAGLTVNPAFAEGRGKIITGKTELYLLTEVYSRVSFEKVTNGATDSTGGIIYFNNSGTEPGGGYLYSSATVINKTLTITVKPNENYAFSNLYVRQRNAAKSAAAGKIVFEEGSSEWLAYDDGFNDKDANGFNISRSTDKVGNTVFTVVMRGDMELRFEFYRVYKLVYGAHFTDGDAVYYSPSDSTAPVRLSDVTYNEYGEAYSESDYYLQFGASINLTAPAAPESYVFVGWYLNDVNTYAYLGKILPSDDYLSRQFIVNEYLQGLVVNGYETDELVFVAMYQPVISVAVINEAYYYSAESGHWNSWQSGYLRTEYFDFDGIKVSDETKSNLLRNTKEYAISALEYSAVSDKANGDDRWNLMLRSGVSTDKKAYGAMHSFDVLYQSVPDYDLINDTWENATILFRMESLPSGIKHLGWQYYNWNTGTYENVGYRYEDMNYGIDPSTGNYTIVDYTFEEYRFALEYLFSGEMPYAVSVGDENNGVIDRPLVIRPKLHKIVGVEITQIAYTDGLNGFYTSEFSEIIHPTIYNVTGSDVFYALDDMTMNGEFDYGAKANVRYYDKADGTGESGIINYPVNEDGLINMRYRFVGWRLNWKVGGVEAYRFISFDDSASGMDIDLTYAYNDAPPSEALQLQAVFIVQYKQEFFSYNVAGSDSGYAEALASGGYSVGDAPDLKIALSSGSVPFATYNLATGETGTAQVPYIMNNLSSGNAHVLQYIMDVGCSYTLTVKTDERKADADNFTAYNDVAQGYDPDYDSYYATYFNKNTSNEIKSDALTYTGGSYTVNDVFTVDIQYISKAVVRFNNMMYGSGVTLPDAFATYLTGSDAPMTVWDTDTAYGGASEGQADDGIVEIVTKLRNVSNLHGKFDYSLKGFNSGKGFSAYKTLNYQYAIGSADTRLRSNDGNLFNPTHDSYRRYVVIDYNDGYISGGSLIFGNPSYTGTGGKYSVNNTGNGTAANPYRIYNVTQLRNVSLFFYANGDTCRMATRSEYGGIDYVATVFKLFNDVSLQDYAISAAENIPGGNSQAWVPLCFTAGENGQDLGFDGVLDGGNYMLYNLSVFDGGSPDPMDDRSSNLVPSGDTKNPLAKFDYDGLGGYGIFGCINNGEVKNLKIGDAFVALNADRYKDVGLLAAKIYNSVIDNVTFTQHSQWKTVTNLVMTAQGGARIYMESSAERMGILAGTVSNTVVKNVELVLGSAHNIQMSTSATSVATDCGIGTIIGYVEKNSSIKQLSVTGNASKVIVLNDVSTDISTGGLIGIIKDSELQYSEINNVNMTIGADDLKATVSTGGGIAGSAISSAIYNCSVISANKYNRKDESKGLIIYSSKKAGGQVGYASEKSTVEYAELKGVIRMRGSYVGGVVGHNEGTINNCEISAPNTTTDSGMRLMLDISGAASSASYGGIAGLNDGLINDCYIQGSTGAATVTANFAELGGTSLYVYHSGNSSHNEVGKIDKTADAATIKKSAKNVLGKINVGGIAGTVTGRVYNSFVHTTRITVNLDTLAGDPSKITAHCTAISAGGIAGTLKGGSVSGEGVLSDGSDVGFNYELYGIDGNKEYSTRIQSCFTKNTGVVVVNRVWVDSVEVNQEGTIMASNSITVAGIAGGTEGYVGEYGINTCYSYNDRFSVQVGAFGLANNDGEEGDNKTVNYGWYYASSAMFGGGKEYTAIRTGLRVDGGIFGIVGGEYLDDEHSGANYGCSYCWCYKNTVETRNPSIGTADCLSREAAGDTIRGLDYQYGTQYRSWSDGHTEGNMACPNPPYGISFDDIRATGMESYVYSGSLGIGSSVVTDLKSINVLFGAGFVGMYDPAIKGGNDGRVYRTDPESGRLLVAHDFGASVGDDCIWSLYGIGYGNTVGGQSYAQFAAANKNNEEYILRGQTVITNQ